VVSRFFTDVSDRFFPLKPAHGGGPGVSVVGVACGFGFDVFVAVGGLVVAGGARVAGGSLVGGALDGSPSTKLGWSAADDDGRSAHADSAPAIITAVNALVSRRRSMPSYPRPPPANAREANGRRP
jgi:hypothetical protein